MLKMVFAATLVLGMFAAVQEGDPVTSNQEKRRANPLNSLPGDESPSTVNEKISNLLDPQPQDQSEFRKIQSKIKTATQKLKNAKSSIDQSAAKSELKKALAEDYKYRLDKYEVYLDGLEKRLATMREKLKRRREAKNEMIDLRIKVLEAEIKDLGWPKMRSNSRFGLPTPNSNPLSQMPADR